MQGATAAITQVQFVLGCPADAVVLEKLLQELLLIQELQSLDSSRDTSNSRLAQNTGNALKSINCQQNHTFLSVIIMRGFFIHSLAAFHLPSFHIKAFSVTHDDLMLKHISSKKHNSAILKQTYYKIKGIY